MNKQVILWMDNRLLIHILNYSTEYCNNLKFLLKFPKKGYTQQLILQYLNARFWMATQLNLNNFTILWICPE